MRKLLAILFLLLLTGCGSKKFYTLGENLDIKASIQNTQTIDIVTVTVPKYLKEHKIVKQVTPYQIELVKNAHWLIPVEKNLTQIFINYLQKSMNNPNVHLYPWDSDNKTQKRIAIDIKKFIASNNKVTLRANYKILDLESKTTQVKYFETDVKSDDNIEGMMKAMEAAYLKLLENIKTTLIKTK